MKKTRSKPSYFTKISAIQATELRTVHVLIPTLRMLFLKKSRKIKEKGKKIHFEIQEVKY